METRTTGVRDSSNHDFVDRVATIHVRNTMRWIEDHSPVLRSMIMNGEIGIAGAMYDVSTGKVEFMSGAGAAGAVGNTGASA
jgi:carbonic anhydrase